MDGSEIAAEELSKLHSWAEGVLESDAVIVGSPKHNPRLTAAAHATLALVSAYWERGEALAEREQEVAELRAYAANDPHGWAKASLMSAGPGRSGFELLISTPFGAAMVEHLAAALASADAPNFLSVSASSPELGEIELTIQRAHGKTTAQTLAELREDVARLREGIASAEKWLRDLRADLQGEGLTDYAIAVRERADKLAALAPEQSNG